MMLGRVSAASPSLSPGAHTALHRTSQRAVQHVGVQRCVRVNALRDDEVDVPEVHAEVVKGEAPRDKPPTRWHRASSLTGGAPQTILLSTIFLAAGGILGLLPSLDGPISTLEAILILCGIVTFHELGHFSAARLQGIHVSKFSVGFGPTLLTYQSGPVEFSLRALPLGGFVAFPDNDEDCPYPEDDPDLLKNRPVIDRMVVVSMGVIFNMILAFGILTAQVSNVGYGDTTFNPGVRVPIIIPGGAGERYGLKAGDTILALDDKVLTPGPNAVKGVVDLIKGHRDESVDIYIARGSEFQHLQVLPDIGPDGKGRIGVQLANNAYTRLAKPDGLVDTVSRSFSEMVRLTTATAGGLAGMFSNLGQAGESLSGPVAVVAVGAEVARSSPAGLYAFAAVVNINLAVVNVLPLPALDGGYLLLLSLEAIRGKKLPEGVENAFQFTGFLLLATLGIGLLFKDAIGLVLPK